MYMFVRLNSQLWRRGHRLLRAELVSTNALTCSFSSSSVPVDSMLRRLSRAVNPSVSMVPVLQQWLDEGKNVNLSDLRNSVRQLRKNRRYKEALQISDWMIEKNCFELSAGDAATRLDLISRVYGLEAAEEYFNNISESGSSLGGYKIYGALLSCYTRCKQLEKAEAMIQKMKDRGFTIDQFLYNDMLVLYHQIGEYEKLNALVQEMEEKGIESNTISYTVRMNAYVVSSDIKGMEKLLMKMEVDPNIKMDFSAYSVAANGYSKAGLLDKALTTLKKSENLIRSNSRKSNYEVLLKQYAALGAKDDVYRIWGLYKKMPRKFNTGYICMIGSLIRMDDLDGAEMIWKEWESRITLFDIRIPNLMINAYSAKGCWEKAEAYIDKIVECGKEPNAISWDNLATGYRQRGMMRKAVETLKKSILASKAGWIPSFDNMTACLDYLKREGDNETADELLKMINGQSNFETGTSWVHLAAGYLLSSQVTKAVEMVKKAVLASKPERQVRYDTVAAFLKHLNGQGDKGAVEELLKMINQHCHFSRPTYNRLASIVNDQKHKTKDLCQLEDDDDDEIFG